MSKKKQNLDELKNKSYPEELLTLINKVTSKRPKTVLDHILKHGYVTTEELTKLYGYEHAPRAARDVRENGIPLETIRVSSSEGKSIGAYILADIDKIEEHKLGGRKTFSKDFKNRLCELYGESCAVCNTTYKSRYLQIDHKIPYEVAGESIGDESTPESFMLLCGSCNRAKDWSCEHCENWTNSKDPSICEKCYWCSPENYEHIAMKPERRIELVWSDDEIESYSYLLSKANEHNMTLIEYLKKCSK